MTHWDDALGDEIKAAERVETERAAARGDAVVVRVDGAGFSKFTAKVQRPFDARIHEAMVAATEAVVDAFNCKLGYTQSDEATFVLHAGDGDLPHAGRLQKLSSRFASKFGSHFLLSGLELFPEAIGRMVPDFDGRAFPCDRAMAARIVMWREIDARKNAVSMAARAVFPHNALHGKSSRTMKEMMLEEGVDFSLYPEAFRRGTFLRRVVERRLLTEAEMERIPADRRPTEPVARSRIARVSPPPLTLVQNLEALVFENADPVVPERPGFAEAVTP